MTDPRPRLAEALQDQFPHATRPQIDYAAAYLLSLPGIAIVELPEPSYVDEPEDDGVNGYGFNGGPADSSIASEHGVYVHDGLVYDQYDGMTPGQARTIASWLLAAANAAETAS